jgi:hypothetical protein
MLTLNEYIIWLTKTNRVIKSANKFHLGSIQERNRTWNSCTREAKRNKTRNRRERRSGKRKWKDREIGKERESELHGRIGKTWLALYDQQLTC